MARKTFILVSFLLFSSLMLLSLTWAAEEPKNDSSSVASAEGANTSEAIEPAVQDNQGATTTVEAQKKPEGIKEPPRGWLAQLWWMADQKPALGRAAVFAIALLAAFLTVVEVWQIPPPNTRALNVRATPSAAADGSTSQADPKAQAYGGAALLFSSNFARTVLSGLAGLALVSTFDGLWLTDQGAKTIQEKPYYLVLFVLFFLLILFTSALLRGLTEALRSRVALVRREPPHDSTAHKAARGQRRTPLHTRFWWWFLSLKIPLLVLWDTFFNVIQGKNQLRSAAFENDIAELHMSLLRGVDRLRRELDEAFRVALNRQAAAQHPQQPKTVVEGFSGTPAAYPPKPNHPEHRDCDVRVNIGLMAADESAVFYVSREMGSLTRSFGERSLAWLAVHTGHPFWWRKEYQANANKIELFDNSKEIFERLEGRKLHLDEYFQMRGEPDYESFIILPLPWGHRGDSGEYRKAGITISFRFSRDLGLLWNKMDNEQKDGCIPNYDYYSAGSNLIEFFPTKDAPTAIYLKDEELSKVLRRVLPALADLLRFFNDTVFEEYVRPRIRPQ